MQVLTKAVMLPYRSLCSNRLRFTLLSVSISQLTLRAKGQTCLVRAQNCEAHSVRSLTGSEKRRFRGRSMFASTNDELIDALQEQERMSGRVADAMRRIDRKYFVPRKDTKDPRSHLEFMFAVPGQCETAYLDMPLPIGLQQTISAPHMHATALELLADNLQPGAHVLDVGSGSGYLTAVMGEMVGDEGRVLGVERHPQLAERSVKSVEAAAPDLLRSGRVRLVAGNALDPQLLAQDGPFDAIHVGAAAAFSDMVQVLTDNLKPSGRMVVPVGMPNDDAQMLKLVEKDADGVHVHERDLMQVRFVPLHDLPPVKSTPTRAQGGAPKPSSSEL